MKHIFFFIMITLAFYCCSTANAVRKLNFDFYVRIDEAQGAVKATATVFEGETSLKQADIPGGVKYQGKSMDLMTQPEKSYQRQFNSGFSTVQLFSWVDAAGQAQEFKTQMNQIKSFGFEHDTVSNNLPAVLHWDGSPLERGESMVLMWENPTSHQTVPIELFTISSESRVDLPALKMKPLTPGQWTLYLVRKKLVRGNVNGSTVTCNLEQYTKPKHILVR
jgi:hypothetical protein